MSNLFTHAMKRRPTQGCSGAALVEFAIVLPLLIILLFGFIELGRMLYQQNQLTKQVSVGARYLSRVPSAVIVDEGICVKGSAWGSGEDQATRWVTQSETGGDILANVALEFTLNEGNASPCVIRTDASAPFAAIFGDSIVPLLNLGPITLNASAEERYIGV